MALTEKIEFQSITILADGQIQIRRDRVVVDNETGEELGRRPHRWVVEPGQSVTDLPQRVQRIAAAVWTPQVVSEFRASRAEQIAKLERGNPT